MQIIKAIIERHRLPLTAAGKLDAAAKQLCSPRFHLTEALQVVEVSKVIRRAEQYLSLIDGGTK